MKSSSFLRQGAHKRKFSSEDHEWFPSGRKNHPDHESSDSSDSSETISAPASPEPEFSPTSALKTRKNYASTPETYSFDFVSKIQSRIDVKSLDGFVKAQCRVCGINPKKCLNIFEGGGEISKIMNKFLPMKVSPEDMLPNFACLECVGVLQAMDDLAYRAYLVEVSFRRSGISAGVDRSSKLEMFSEQKENIETVSPAGLNSRKEPDEDNDSSQDTFDCNLLVPEVNLRTSSEPLRFGNDCVKSSQRAKIFIHRKKSQVPLKQTENEGLQRYLNWHSYAKPFSEAANSTENAEECAKVGSAREPKSESEKLSADKRSHVSKVKIIAPRQEVLAPNDNHTKPTKDAIEPIVVLKEKTQQLANSSGNSVIEQTLINKSIQSQEEALLDMSLHSYAKPAKDAEQERVLKETVQRPSGVFNKTQMQIVASSQEKALPKVRVFPPTKSTVQTVALKGRTQPLSSLVVIGGRERTRNGKSVAPGKEEVLTNKSLHSYAKPANSTTQQKVVVKETASPLSELLKIGKTDQVVTMAKFTQLITDIAKNASTECGGKLSQAAGKNNRFMLQVSKVKRTENGLVVIAPRPGGPTVTSPSGQKPASPTDSLKPPSPLDSKKPTPLPKMAQEKKGRLFIHGCYICNRKFGEYQHLFSHMQVSHSAADKSCPVCEKVFDQASIQPLLSHRKIHSEAEAKKWTVGFEVRTDFKCESCSKFFVSRIHKIYHDIYHHQLSLSSCEFCDAECFSSVALEKHRKICGASSKNFEKSCHVCLGVCKNPIDFKQHVESHDERYTCDYCFTTFTSSRLLEDHVQVDHAEKPYSCGQCGKSFVIEPMLTRHLQSFHPVSAVQSSAVQEDSSTDLPKSKSKLRFSCAACDEVFSSRGKYKQHRKTHNFDKRRKCSICGKVFPSISEINIHRCQEHKEFMCKNCGCNCSSLEKLRYHTARCLARHGERKPRTNTPRVKNGQQKKRTRCTDPTHVCETCGRKFSDKCSLRRHVTIHTGERPYMCAVCGKTFRTKELHFTHSKRHTDVKQYACPFCDSRFRRMDELYAHKRIYHLQQFKYHCKVCNRSYNSPKYFVMHMQMCTNFNQPPVELDRSVMRCLICPQYFHSEVSLKTHEKCMHDLDHPPICGFCFEKFLNVNSLKKHVEMHYNSNEIKDIICPMCKKTCANSREFRVHPCGSKPNSAGPNSDSVDRSSTSGPPQNSVEQAGSTEDESNTRDTCESPASPVSASLSKLVVSSDETNSLDEYVDMLNRTKFTSENTQKGTEDSTEKSENRTVVSESEREKSPAHPQNIGKNGSEQPASVPVELINNMSNDDMIYHCTFCETDFYDNNVFLSHLKNEHNLGLNDLDFHFKE